MCMKSTIIKLAVGAPWSFAFYKQNKTKRKRKKHAGKYSIKISKSKEE
jgi:hypothetical protein